MGPRDPIDRITAEEVAREVYGYVGEEMSRGTIRDGSILSNSLLCYLLPNVKELGETS